MSDAKSTVLVIDDDPDLRASVGRLLRSVGLEAQLFASISDFLKSDPPDGPTCLVLDVRLPEQSGLDFQRELAAANRELPIIFITGHGDIPMSVQAMKGGAIEFLTKPFREQDLLDAIQLGLEKDRYRRKKETALDDLRARFATLSPREREVLVQVVRGRLSKQIAGEFGTAYRDPDAIAAIGERAHHMAAEEPRAAEHGDQRFKLALGRHRPRNT